MKSRIDAQIVNSLVQGAMSHLSSRYNMSFLAEKPFLKSSNLSLLENDIMVASSTIVRCRDYRAEITIIFPEATYKDILFNNAENLSCDQSELLKKGSVEILKGICSEIAECLIGKGYYPNNASTNKLGGLSLQMKRLSKKPAIIIPFNSESATFFLEFSEFF